jgi:hypothetical protein
MTKFRGALCATALAVALIVAGASTAFAAPRPVAADNTPSSGFAAAQACDCHSNFITEWQQSMHAKALSDPLFKAELADTNAATSNKMGPFCQTCHGPVGTMTNQLGSSDPNSASAQGIPCSFCHQVTGASSPTNNVSLLVDPSGTYRAQIATPTAPHPTAVSPFHNTSAICGSCHNVSHPGNGLPIEATYSEWLASPQAKAGTTCQDCHMTATPGQVGPTVGWDAGGGPRRPVYQMTFVGPQVGQSNPIDAQQLLQSAATVQLDAPGILDGATSTSVTVTITNVGAGHDLPTGLTEVRQMWLDVTFTGPDGKVTEVGKHAYGTVLKDANGKYPAALWAATGVQSDDRIPPKGTSVSSYRFDFPSGVDNGTIKAQLLYRSAPDDLAKKAATVNPTTVMAEQSQPIYATTDAERKANASTLNDVAASPIDPLVISILGLVACFGLIIFFVWWGRRPAPKAPRPARKSRVRAAETDEAAASADEAAAQPTEAFPPVKESAPDETDASGTEGDKPDGE